MRSLLNQLSRLLHGRRISTVAELHALLAGEAVYLSQKATIDYCRARAGLGWQRLVSEPAFLAALEACRWQAMAAVLADQTVIAEGFLRPHVRYSTQPLAAALAAAFLEILEASPAPADARVGWPGQVADLAVRLARAQMGEVHRPDEIARTSGARIFELLPIHPAVRRYDREIVINSVRFGMVAFSETLARVADRPAMLAESLIAAAPPSA